MILDEYVEIIGNSRNLKYYKEKGYDIEVNKKILIKTEDLSNGSTFKVNIKCDICQYEKKITWSSYHKYKEDDKDKKYHCIKCCSEKRKLTNLKKYGGNSPTKSKEVVNKIKKTNLERYGNNSSLHGLKQEQTERIFLEKYGCKTPLSNSDIKEKIKNTLIERYGVEHPLKSNDILKKTKETNLLNWGFDNPSKSKIVLEKIKETNFKKWGVDFYYKSDDFKEKRDKKILEKYGSIDYFKSKHRIENVISNKIENYPHNAEIEICNFLEEHNLKVTTSRRDIIRGELDIYLPDHKIAIEYNGLYWHSDIFKDDKYHLSKYNDCKEIGIKLIQIWEDQWKNNKNKVKSFLLSKLKIYKNKIWARDCKIGYVNYKEKDLFLDQNHLQKSARSSINIGLYYKKELVSIMTFGKRRLNSKESFELIRYCCKRDLIIVGGASKLFKYFTKNNNFDSIISYSDNTVSDGDIYKLLNFENINESKNYYWTDNKNRYHRFTFNKKRLVKMGYDSNKTEVELMRGKGFNKIHGAGIKTWIYKL